MMTFSREVLETLLADILLSAVPNISAFSARQINTDTRCLQKGDAFVALSGEQFDGHNFAQQAVEKGAEVLLVEKVLPIVVPQIVVKDTRLALGKLASYIRDNFKGQVVGLTGSVGKTTNKQMLASILSQRGKTHMTKGNLNNDLGVPFTWFDLDNDAEFAVIEMGANHRGEIDYLAKITRPDVGMITNAGESHLEGFGGLDGVAKGKGELFKNLVASNTAVVNLDDKYADYWRTLLVNGVKVKTFSLHDSQADVYAEAISADGAEFTLCTEEGKFIIQLPTVGLHNVKNALGCAACALALGLTAKEISQGLAGFETAKGRLQIHRLGKLTVIDDTYNANPMSMRASADILAQNDGTRLMVIGDMGELGEDELELHAQLGRDLRNKADAFYCFGERMGYFVVQNEAAKHFSEIEVLTASLTDRINSLLAKQQKVTVLIKGSRSMQMERVVTSLLTFFSNLKST